MKHIKVAERKFELAPRWARLVAFGINLVCLFIAAAFITVVVTLAGAILMIPIMIIGAILDLFMDFPFSSREIEGAFRHIVAYLAVPLILIGSHFIKIGSTFMKIHVIRLKDSRQLTFKEAFLRKLVGFFQPLDISCVFWPEQQRLADKLAGTVVVRAADEELVQQIKTTETVIESEAPDTANQAEDPEQVLEAAIREMKAWLSEGRQKVNESIKAEKQLQAAHDNSLAQADRYYANAMTALQAQREDAAREELRKRSGYQQLTEQCKKHCEAQKQVIGALNNLLDHLRQKVIEMEDRKADTVLQHRNIDTEVHLREILQEIQENPLMQAKLETTEVVTLVQAETEADLASQGVGLEEEFAQYAEEASIDKDLAELKAKLQT